MVRERSQINHRFHQFFTHKHARSTLQTSLGASGPIVGSTGPVGSTGHAAALSGAVAKASERVDDVLKSIEYDGNVDYADVVDYLAKVERYPNHRLPERLDPSILTQSEWHKVGIAAEASTAVYNCLGPTEVRELVTGSWNGVTKNMTLETRSLAGTNTLVVAIRGSVTMMDWAVNANTEPADAPELGEHARCHRGFLDVARLMDKSAAHAIRQSKLRTDEPLHLLFTGHSAGAAVAQLLFAFVHEKTTNLSEIASTFQKIDCITFAGPPITVPPIPCPSGSLFLCVINEGDPIPLAQTQYVDSLLEAFVRPPPVEPVIWQLPEPFYSLSGTCVVLRDMVPDEADVLDIRAFTVMPAVLNKALFGNLVLHSMTEYRDRVVMLEERASEFMS